MIDTSMARVYRPTLDAHCTMRQNEALLIPNIEEGRKEKPNKQIFPTETRCCNFQVVGVWKEKPNEQTFRTERKCSNLQIVDKI